MGHNVTEKILNSHLAGKRTAWEPGDEMALVIDQTLTQDATGTMVYLQFEAMGIDRARNELAVSYVDHNTVQVGSENADDHAYLRSVAEKYGIIFSRPGNGVCHQVHLERFAVPGKTLLGSDSHTPTCGGLGMLAIGAGGIDVAMAMAGEPFYLAAPRVIRIELSGRLRPFVTAKDVVLHVLALLSTKGNVGCVLEYGGPALRYLDVPARSTITNMGAECGVTTSVFPSDQVTHRFLAAQGRADAWRELVADEDAHYDRVVEINLSDLAPMAAAPHSPGNVVAVASLAGTVVNQVLIGSCTNSSYRDLKTVARILAGRTVHPGVSLGIAPGSRQVLGMLAREKLLSDLIGAGARILESACGFCIGNSLSPSTGDVSLRTSNRNFEGRSGTQSAQVYLVSPEVAAVSAVCGRIVDPSVMDDFKCPQVKQPGQFVIDDSMLVFPGAVSRDTQIIRGPNIGIVPANEPLPERLAGVATIKVGDKITTDHIMPAGQRLKYRSNVNTYAGFVFESTDPAFASRARENRDNGVHNFIVAGESYGQGSSREHAALCPMYLGVKAVVAISIERIHLANLINFGIVPLLFVNGDDYARVEQDDTLAVEGIREIAGGIGTGVLRNETSGIDIPIVTRLSDRQKGIVLRGGLLNSVMKS